MMKAGGNSVSGEAAAEAVLPVGFRFRPTDVELVRHYLKAKIAGRTHPDLLLIPDVDLSACEPWDLPSKSLIKSDDPEWFFFAPRDPKYPGGHRSNRSTAAGYWKATGKDRLIRHAGALIGIKKTLVFHRGRAPRGHRTAWIMHEYRATEPNFQSGQNGSFVLYRLFNKHEQQDDTQEQQLHSMAPSTSSPGNPHNNTVSVQAGLASVMKDETVPLSDLSQLTEIQNVTDDADRSMAHLLTSVDGKDQTKTHDDDFLGMLYQLPDLEPEQSYSGFPNITSPMRPYSDNPFVSNLGGQELSAHFGSIISEQDLHSLLLSPNSTIMDKHPIGHAETNPAMLTNNSNSNALLVDNWRDNDSYQMLPIQRADDTDAACCSSSINAPQTETGSANLEVRAQSGMVYCGVSQSSHLCNQYQLQSTLNPHTESQMSGSFCLAGSRVPYPQHWFSTMVEPGGSSMTFSNALKEQGQEPPPSIQQLAVQDLVDPQQGTAARRIRLVCSVQRASISQPVSTSQLQTEYEAGSCCNTCSSSDNNKENVESEDEAGSCCTTGSSSDNHNEENAISASQTMDGEPMHIQCNGNTPIQVDPTMEVTDKLQGFSFHEEILSHADQPRGTNLKKRFRLEYTNRAEENAPGEPSLETRRHQTIRSSVVPMLWCALFVMGPLLLLVGVWKSLKSLPDPDVNDQLGPL
uniref:NAC domain-containing protein n=1 Tax=Leersia perrieri TaxID=77586 RepID=A0A0D9WKP7_9ORYZ